MSTSIAITGFGAVSALGMGAAALWSALEAGQDGIRPIDRFSTEGFSTCLGGLVPGFSTRSGSSLSIEWAVAAAREALAQARPIDVPPERIALVVGTSPASYKETLHRFTEAIGDALELRGPRITISTACTSSTNALGLAKDLLQNGLADRVIAGGADLLTAEVFAGFHALGVLSVEKCAPFSEPPGTTLGEGAGFLVLERESLARARNASFSALLCGYGLSADAHHATSPDPTGAGVARAIFAALQDAGIEPVDIDYVNAHGTGTSANDLAEWRAMQTVFAARANQLPVSSSKAHLAHAQAAAGALELITTLLCMQHGTIPPTLHFTKPRPRGPVDPVAQEKPRPASVRHAVCSNSAFGGANAAVVIASREAHRPRENVFPAERRLAIMGMGLLGAHGRTLDEFDRALAAPQKIGNRVADFKIEDIVPTADPRGLDPSSRYLTAVTAMALSSAGVVLRGAVRDKCGLFVGMQRISPESGHLFDSSIKERGLARLSATAFTKMVLNASAGACSKLLMIKGPTTTMTTGDGSGLSALVYAAQFLAHRRDLDVLVASGVDERSHLDNDENLGEGAASFVLGRVGETNSKAKWVLEGYGLAGPGQIQTAIEQACVMAQVSLDEVDRFPSVEPIWGKLVAAGPLFALAAALRALERGEKRRVLITDEHGQSVSSAVIVTAVHVQEEASGS